MVEQDNKPVFGASGRKIVYDEDGKPCRACNTLLDFKMANMAAPKISPKAVPSAPSDGAANNAAGVAVGTAVVSSTISNPYPKDCPPDVTQLGRSTWTFLHSVAARYPKNPTTEKQAEMTQFINLFAKLYPCTFCATDFQNYISKEETKPKVKTQEEFGKWLCDAHNEVNLKLGKPKFDCNLWKQRWKDGWEDGSCD